MAVKEQDDAGLEMAATCRSLILVLSIRTPILNRGSCESSIQLGVLAYLSLQILPSLDDGVESPQPAECLPLDLDDSLRIRGGGRCSYEGI